MVVVVAQPLQDNQQLLQNQIHTAAEVLEYFHTWAGLVHFILQAVAQDLLILAQAALVIQQPAVAQQQELVGHGEQIQTQPEMVLQEQQIVEVQVEVPRLVMALINESVAAAALA
jgi:hypothetical protein